MAELKIKADSGGGTVSLKGPATTTSNAAVQLTLPVDDGTASQYLQTNGSGVLSWATVSSTPEGTAIKSTGEAATKFLRADGDNTCSWQVPPDTGKIIQYKHSSKTDASSRAHTVFADIPGTDENGSGSVWECNITTTGSNKVLVIASVNVSTTNMSWLKLIRNTSGTDTDLGKGDTVSGKRSIWYGSYGGGASTGEMYHGTDVANNPILDSPGAGTHTYRVQFASDSTSYTTYVNRCAYDSDPYHGRYVSSITLLELAA